MNDILRTTVPTQLPCPHSPVCPAADAADHDAAKVVDNHHADAGYVRLCNGVYLFDDTGEIQPSGLTVAPHRPAAHYAQAV